MERKKGIGLRDAWRLSRPYWTSEEKWSAWGLLLATIALNLGNVYINVRLNEWRNAFYNALQKLDAHEFFHQLLIFTILAGFYVVMAVYAFYLPAVADALAPLVDPAISPYLAYRSSLLQVGADEHDR
jgi:ABC-type uncharacterized transport system fused permease/ATPase subunit